jgi:hypothetical protein
MTKYVTTFNITFAMSLKVTAISNFFFVFVFVWCRYCSSSIVLSLNSCFWCASLGTTQKAINFEDINPCTSRKFVNCKKYYNYIIPENRREPIFWVCLYISGADIDHVLLSQVGYFLSGGISNGLINIRPVHCVMYILLD